MNKNLTSNGDLKIFPLLMCGTCPFLRLYCLSRFPFRNLTCACPGCLYGFL